MTEQNPIQPGCPSCGATMNIVRLQCPACSTEVTGVFSLCPVCRLEAGMRSLFDAFLNARGNLKDVQKIIGVSYPTVLKRIEEMFVSLGLGQAADRPDSKTILTRLSAGEITVEQAERLLRGEPGHE
jgi:hypothetical protein